mgnify:CR=1 FL=1
MIKKCNAIFALFALSLILFANLISADSFQTAVDSSRKVIESMVGILTPFFELVIGSYSTEEFFFAKILLLILLALIINAVLRKVGVFDKSPGVILTVSLIVSILAVRFISENQMTLGILLPYGTLGVAITTIIPFLIFFYFIHVTNMGGAGRRLSWIFFGLVFIILWIYKYDKMSSVSNQIYGWALFLMVFAFIFDKGIHRYFLTHEINRFVQGANARTIAMLQAEYLNIVGVNTREANSRKADIEAQLRRLGANLP